MTGPWPALVVAGAGLGACVLLALWCDARRLARREAAENARLRARLDTYGRVLSPLPDAVRAGRALMLPPRDLAVLSLLIEEEGPEGDEIAALEELFHQPPETLDTEDK